MRWGFDEDADDTRMCLRVRNTFIVCVSLWAPCLRSASWEIERGERFFFFFRVIFRLYAILMGIIYSSTKTVWFKLLIAIFNWKNEDIWATTILPCEFRRHPPSTRSWKIWQIQFYKKFDDTFTQPINLHSFTRFLVFILRRRRYSDEFQDSHQTILEDQSEWRQRKWRRRKAIKCNCIHQTAAERHSCEQAAAFKATLSLRCITSKIGFSLLCCCHFDLFWMSSIIIVAKS